MMLEHLFNSSFLYSLSLTLLHFLWQGLLVALVLKSALLVVSNKNPQLRYALSALAMLANLLLPLITFGGIYRAELALTGSSTSALTITNLMQGLKQQDSFFGSQEVSELLPSLLPYLALLWLATVTLLASKLLLEIYNVNKLPKQGSIAPSKELLARFNELAKQLNLTVTPTLLISMKVDVPMAIGWLKPVVLIPATMISGLNASQLEMLILHELAHIRRHDYLVNFLQTFVEILLFFHPAVLWVSKQMRNEREYCSDDIAVQHCGNAVAYAHTLADTASLCTKARHKHTIPSMAMAASGGDLKQRVIRLVDHHCAPQESISKWLASATIIFTILLLSSKQLLTIPLLDLWHNELPFKAKNAEANQESSLLAYKSDPSSSKNLATRAIAMELSAPQTLENNQNSTLEQPKAITTKMVPIETEQAQIVSNTHNSVLLSDNQANKQKVTANDDARFSTQLDNLSMSEHKPASNYSETIQPSTSSMVEQAFEETDSKQHSTFYNPYAQELDQLASSAVNTTQSSALPISQQQDNTDLITQSDVNNTAEQTNTLYKESLPQVTPPSQHADLFEAKHELLAITTKEAEYGLEQELMPEATPIWHDAEQLKLVNPVYPSIAKRKGIEIEVIVDFTIDVNGQTKDIRFAQQNKISYFKSAIRSAIKQWRFLPAKVDDQPVESQMSKVFAFSLQS